MKTYRYPDKNTDRIIDLVESRFDEWIFESISDLLKYNSRGISLGFVIMSCAIDYLAGLNKGTDQNTNGNDYKQFLRQCDWFSKKYDVEDIYNFIRCGLVHNYSLRAAKYGLMHNHPEKHLAIEDGRTILNYEDFFQDIKRLKKEFFEKIKTDNSASERLVERVKNFGFLGPVQVNN